MNAAPARLLRGELVNNIGPAGGQWPTRAHGKHLEPGVVTYDNDDGSKTTYLLTREAIARMRLTATGKPIVGRAGGFDHMKVNAADAAKGKYDGDVFASMDDGDGWEGIDFLIRDQETKARCADGYQLSCAYIPTETDGKPGLWHNVPFDETILDGEYTHFAVVPNPRYEGATIELLNSKGGGFMNKVLKAALSLVPIGDLREVFNSLDEEDKKKQEAKAASEKKNADEKAGKRKAAQEAYDASMKNASSDEDRAKAKEAFEKMNAEIDAASGTEAAPAGQDGRLPPQPLGGGDVVPEPGIPGQDPLKPAVANAETPEKAQEREKKALEAKNAAEKEKADLEKKNADDAAAKKKEAEDKAKKDDEEKKNSLAAKAKAEADAKAEAQRVERFNTLRRAADERGGSTGTPFVGIVSSQEKEDLGRHRYGSRA